ncbi:MAG: RimK family alpha-L-glutamate ligase [Proteobacteria bacterium]|nr:RimK family alpha-L-glutamate ligase [Pseudomonadota bacterium]
MNLITEPNAETRPSLIGVAALTRRCYEGENLIPLGQALLARAEENPMDANAHLDLSTVLLLTGNGEHGLAVQTEAIKLQPLYSLPAAAPSLRLLAIKGPGDLMANTPVEFLLENSDVSLELLYLLPDAQWPDTVPDHDVMMVAVGESDENQALLSRLAGYVSDWPRPVINHPERIAALSRDGVCAVLKGAPGIEIPVTTRVSRAELQALADGGRNMESFLPDGGFPIIVRPLGSHAGTHLDKLPTAADITAYLEQVPAEGFYISRFVDYRGSDGLFRKYRIALIEGKPFVCHFAVSEHWIIHYANAGMSESAEKRAEEARVMETFDTDFAVRHRAALQAIHDRMGLPYLGVDCAEPLTGELLIFEVDNSMVVHALDPEDVFPYKKPAMQKVFTAFRQMLEHARQTAIAG